jgi:pSer/pThr/pTyr-binding forkhead associated (FHA) protein
MSTGLVAYALKFFADPDSVKREVIAPVLIWERESAPGDEAESAMTTLGGAHTDQPMHGEPLVLPLIKGIKQGNAFGLGVTVGRTENNDIVLSHTSVSRFHGYFLQDTKTLQWKLVDAESKNGTWIEGVKLSPNRPEVIPPKAKLRFGHVEVRFFTPEQFFAHLQQMQGA